MMKNGNKILAREIMTQVNKTHKKHNNIDNYLFLFLRAK